METVRSRKLIELSPINRGVQTFHGRQELRDEFFCARGIHVWGGGDQIGKSLIQITERLKGEVKEDKVIY